MNREQKRRMYKQNRLRKFGLPWGSFNTAMKQQEVSNNTERPKK